MNAGFKDHFSTVAAGYAAHRPVYPPALAEYLAGLAPQHRLVWEAGCGSGQLSVLLAPHFERVFATDASAEQIAHAVRCPNVDYRAAKAERCELPDGAADLAVAAQAAHWFDLSAYYAEVRRVVRPGGVVALVSYGIHSVNEDVDRVVGRFYHGPLDSHWPPERRHVEAGYRTLPFPFAETAAPLLEMTAEWPLAGMLDYVGTWSALQSLERAGARREFEAFRTELAAAWGPPETRRRVRWPLSLRVGQVAA